MLTVKMGGELYQGETREALGQIFDACGYERPLLLYDKKIAIGDILVMDFTGMVGLDCDKEPTYDDLDRIIAALRQMHLKRRWDVVIGIGGGSTLDITKAVAALLANPGEPKRYRGFNKVRVPGVPVIAIPATLSGSEATNNASFVDTEEKRKMGINGTHMFAAHAILDSRWLPPKGSKVFASTYLDAVTHAYESMVCRQANGLTRPVSEKALELLMSGIIDQIQLGAHMAGRALCNSGSGISGAISYALGVHYGVPHGIAGGIWLPDVMEFNGSDNALSDTVREYIATMEISTNLQDYGVGSVEEFHELIKPFQAAFDQNPKKFDAEIDGLELIKKHFGEGSAEEQKKEPKKRAPRRVK